MNFDIEENSRKKNYSKKQKMQVYLSLFFFILAIILIIIYFATQNNSTESEVEQTPNIEIKEEKKLTIIDEKSNERPLAVMIDNNIGDAKHAGLQESYINYEIIVEGGLTRIMSIYKDREVSIIGPIRSARHYFLDYALEYDAVYAHFGWSTYAEDNIKSLNVQNINGMVDSEPFARDRNLPSPHNVFSSTTKLRSYFETKNYSNTSNDWKVFKYSIEDIKMEKQENVIQASHISMNYSTNENRSYSYDSDNNYYLREMNGKAHIDRSSNNQLHYKNIIIMKVANRTIDSEGRQDLDTVGSGTGFYITNGYAREIKWSKSSRKDKTYYTYNDGTEVILNDGNTFIQIMPISSDIVIE